MRIVGIGTKANPWKPTAKQLQLADWDQSYLEWADLSGLTIPRMRDADLRNYKATGTVFGNTDWTIMRRGDVKGAIIPSDVSSFNHDLVVEVLRTASNASNPAVALVRDHIAASYLHSWNDSIYRLRTELGMTSKDILTVFLVAFRGYPRLVSRLAEMVQLQPRAVPPGEGQDTSSPMRVITQSGDRLERFDLFLQGTDRYIAARAIEKAQPDLVVHVDQIDPWPNVQIVERTILTEEWGWWRRGWPG